MSNFPWILSGLSLLLSLVSGVIYFVIGDRIFETAEFVLKEGITMKKFLWFLSAISFLLNLVSSVFLFMEEDGMAWLCLLSAFFWATYTIIYWHQWKN